MTVAVVARTRVSAQRHRPGARRWTIAAALLTIAVQAYGVLPPHSNIGVLVAALGVGYGVLLLLVETLRKRQTDLPAGVS